MPQTKDWYQTVEQAKAQFTMWSLMSAPLLISADPGQVEPELVEHWGNEEIIEVSQTFREGGPYQAARIVGDDGFWYDPQTRHGAGSQVWGKLLPGGDFALGFVNNEDNETAVTCDEACFDQLFAPPPPPACAAEQFAPMGDVQCEGLSWRASFSAEDCCAACTTADCETYQYCADGEKCATGGGQQVTLQARGDSWYQNLGTPAFNGAKTPGCYVGKMNNCTASTNGWQSMKRVAAPVEPPTPVRPASLAMRDLWEHTVMPTLTPPFTFTATLEPSGGVAIYRFSPPKA